MSVKFKSYEDLHCLLRFKLVVDWIGSLSDSGIFILKTILGKTNNNLPINFPLVCEILIFLIIIIDFILIV